MEFINKEAVKTDGYLDTSSWILWTEIVAVHPCCFMIHEMVPKHPVDQVFLTVYLL